MSIANIENQVFETQTLKENFELVKSIDPKSLSEIYSQCDHLLQFTVRLSKSKKPLVVEHWSERIQDYDLSAFALIECADETEDTVCLFFKGIEKDDFKLESYTLLATAELSERGEADPQQLIVRYSTQGCSNKSLLLVNTDSISCMEAVDLTEERVLPILKFLLLIKEALRLEPKRVVDAIRVLKGDTLEGSTNSGRSLEKSSGTSEENPPQF